MNAKPGSDKQPGSLNSSFILHPSSLSIVIPSHRRADLLRLCLASVQRFAPPNTEVIVVDDCSRDAVVSCAAAEFAGVKVVRRAKAGGFCVAANAGIAVATAPVVELLNDDAEATAGWADAALRWFADPRIVAVAPLVLQNDPGRIARGLPPLIDTAGDEYDMGGFATKRRGRVGDTEMGRQEQGLSFSHSPCLPLSPSLPLPQSVSTNHAGTVWGASAAAAFYRRDAIIEAGGFPEHFKAYFEDVDLSFRLRRLGGEVMYDPASVVWHRVSSSYGKRPSRRTLEQQSCNEERVFWRNVRGLDRARWLPRHTAVLGGKAVKRLQEGTLLPWLLGRVRAALT
ncbi:MAG: glycosyltransferase [Planctomycetaceae bacterium]|nr:glycosyltransferase [Planctomycetaceae bacterium]